ncbi:MAG: aminoacyl-tRNA hydrolase [Agitococcus sp.]|nr:aminoacyl-tRNA hydrolase [Agitococcus sp.]
MQNDGTHKQVLVLRKDLKMPKGKLVAQGAHASLGAVLSVGREDPRVAPWLASRFTKICLAVNSEAELLALHETAKAQGLITCLVQDSGFTVFNGVPTYTALGIGPDTLDNINRVTAALSLL